jgi:hypothetical protein
MIAPYSEGEGINEPDVSLELGKDGHQYLHLILPADKIKFLNGGDSGLNNTFFNDKDESLDYEQLMVEVGCKVFEVNRVAYKPVSGLSYLVDTIA